MQQTPEEFLADKGRVARAIPGCGATTRRELLWHAADSKQFDALVLRAANAIQCGHRQEAYKLALMACEVWRRDPSAVTP